MSPVLKRKREKFHLPSKYILFILTALCIGMMVLSFTTNLLAVPLNYISSVLIVPFENGLTSVGTYTLEKTQQLQELRSVLKENEQLKEQINELTIENTRLQQEKYELTKLRELYELDAEYEEYSKIGARIISRDASNWYSSFVIVFISSVKFIVYAVSSEPVFSTVNVFSILSPGYASARIISGPSVYTSSNGPVITI